MSYAFLAQARDSFLLYDSTWAYVFFALVVVGRLKDDNVISDLKMIE